MNLDDNAKPSDSICTCKSCDHRIAPDCMKANCNCCTDANHCMVLDGIDGFTFKTSIKNITSIK